LYDILVSIATQWNRHLTDVTQSAATAYIALPLR